MVTTIAIIVLASAVIQVLAVYRDLARQKNSLERAWDDLDGSLQKKATVVASLVDASQVFMAQEKNIFKNLLIAKRELLEKEIPVEKAQAELKLDAALNELSLVAKKYPSFEKNVSFLKIQDELKGVNLEIQAAKRFYNVNVIDFNDKFKSFFKRIIAKLVAYKKREYFDSEAKEDTHLDYRSEFEGHRTEEIERCKRRCELNDYKKNFGTDYIILMPSVVLTLFLVGVVLYALYGFFSTMPIAQKLYNQIASKAGSSNNQPAVINESSVDPSWKTYKNNIFQIKYPADWQAGVDANGEFSLKEIETNSANFAGIDIEIKIGKIDNPENKSLPELLTNTVMAGNNFSMTRDMDNKPLEKEPDMLGGKDSMHADQMLTDTKISMHSNYWMGDKYVYYLDDILYNGDDQKDIIISTRVLDTFKFLN